MDFLSAFPKLSVEDRQAIEYCFMKAIREPREERAAAREYATATSEEEEGTKEGAQAQGMEPRSSKNPSQAIPLEVPTASPPHHATSTTQAGTFHISDTSSRPPVYDGCFKQGEEECMQGEILQVSDGDLVGREEELIGGEEHGQKTMQEHTQPQQQQRRREEPNSFDFPRAVAAANAS